MAPGSPRVARAWAAVGLRLGDGVVNVDGSSLTGQRRDRAGAPRPSGSSRGPAVDENSRNRPEGQVARTPRRSDADSGWRVDLSPHPGWGSRFSARVAELAPAA